MKSLFIAPHYDDSVFSCGKLMSIMEDATALTVFGGVPVNKSVCTAYDQKSGFDNAEEAVLSRREEDSIALTAIGVRQAYLHYVENQYGESLNTSKIKEDLIRIIKNYDEIYIPLGLLHPDHEKLGNLCREIETKDKKFYVYTDLPYYVDNPELFVDKLKVIEDKVYVYRGGDLGKKMIAVACYRSQFPITNIYHLMADERYYHDDG